MTKPSYSPEIPCIPNFGHLSLLECFIAEIPWSNQETGPIFLGYTRNSSRPLIQLHLNQEQKPETWLLVLT
jgi:hypothetical protein